MKVNSVTVLLLTIYRRNFVMLYVEGRVGELSYT